MYNNLQQQNMNTYDNNHMNGYMQMPQNNQSNNMGNINNMGNDNGFQSVQGNVIGNTPQTEQKSLPNDALWAKIKAMPAIKNPPKQEVEWISGTSHLYKKKKEPETDHNGFVPPTPQQHSKYNQNVNQNVNQNINQNSNQNSNQNINQNINQNANQQQYSNNNQQFSQWNNNNNNQQQQ
eukprot:24866_1